MEVEQLLPCKCSCGRGRERNRTVTESSLDCDVAVYPMVTIPDGDIQQRR